MFVIANKEKDLFINEQIRAKEVMVIGPNGEQLGIKSTKDAITLSTYAGFDLVMINPNGNPPVCKVMDYNKYKYSLAFYPSLKQSGGCGYIAFLFHMYWLYL